MPSAMLDHLVLAASTLQEGVDYVRDVLGVEPQGGGKHEGQATHNKLLRLDQDRYLEIIALDPDATPSVERRWFGLDTEAVQQHIRTKPRLLTWIARTTDLEAAVAGAHYNFGRIGPMRRGNLTWRMTFTEDGSLLADGLLPALIQWDSAPHPSRGMPESGCALVRFEAFHRDPKPVVAVLRRLDLQGQIEVREAAVQPFLRATIQTPRGTYQFD